MINSDNGSLNLSQGDRNFQKKISTIIEYIYKSFQYKDNNIEAINNIASLIINLILEVQTNQMLSKVNKNVDDDDNLRSKLFLVLDLFYGVLRYNMDQNIINNSHIFSEYHLELVFELLDKMFDQIYTSEKAQTFSDGFSIFYMEIITYYIAYLKKHSSFESLHNIAESFISQNAFFIKELMDIDIKELASVEAQFIYNTKSGKKTIFTVKQDMSKGTKKD